MKLRIINILASLGIIAVMTSCEIFKETGEAEKVALIKVHYKVAATTSFAPVTGEVEPDPNFPTEGLTAIFRNYSEGYEYTTTVDKDGLAVVDELVPGTYTMDVSGIVTVDGQDWYLNGAAQNIPLGSGITREEALRNGAPQCIIRPGKVGPLCMSEVYWNGSHKYVDGMRRTYFRDQTYHIYNNSDIDYDVAGVCLAQLYPLLATASIPVYPDEDGKENFVYAGVVWQVPTDQGEIILKPGESIVICQKALDHKGNINDPWPNSLDNTTSEFEAWAGNATHDNIAVPNLPLIFKASDAYLTAQWLAAITGPAFCLFKDPEGKVNGSYFEESGNWQTEVGKTAKRAKIPANWIIDGVEAIPDENSLNMKRIPGFVDAGATWATEIYESRSAVRKKIGERADGTPIFQDTNNSINDFEIISPAVMRRYGQKMPSWNWSQQP